MQDLSTVCIGETLWDVLPSGTHLGGAPFNVAAHLARLGVSSILISRVGDDDPGRAALWRAREHGIETRFMQIDPALPTGEARAVLDRSGSARYEFNSPAAWDAIEPVAGALEAVATADVVIFGTLAQRKLAARSAMEKFLQVARWRVFDPNLREPYVDRELCLQLLAQADLVKLNEDEARWFTTWLGCAGDASSLQRTLAERFGTSTLCITRGERGALLFQGGEWTEHSGVAARVVDTVGAGDAFLAMLVAQLLKREPAGAALGRAARLAAYVASCAGAVPEYDAALFNN